MSAMSPSDQSAKLTTKPDSPLQACQFFREHAKTDESGTAVSAVSEHFDTGEGPVLLHVLPKKLPRPPLQVSHIAFDTFVPSR